MAEDLNYAKIYVWGCIEYMHNCHESGELQGFDEIEMIIILMLLVYFSFI